METLPMPILSFFFWREKMKNEPIIHDVTNKVLADNDDNNFTIAHAQHIPTSHLDYLKRQRDASTSYKDGEYSTVASVPVAVHEKWLREGFDMMAEPATKILMRLRNENLDAFITTKKQV